LLTRSSTDAEVCGQPRYSRFKPGHPDGFLEAFANYYSDLADWLQPHADHDGAAAEGDIASAEMALEGLQLMEAITESARCGRWVDVGQYAYAL